MFHRLETELLDEMMLKWRESGGKAHSKVGRTLDALDIPYEWYRDAEHQERFLVALVIVWRRFHVVHQRNLSWHNRVTMHVPPKDAVYHVEGITDDCLVELRGFNQPAHPLWLHPVE
mgnify:CR=1 FL=1